jgi:large subunit ribosomal protein L5
MSETVETTEVRPGGPRLRQHYEEQVVPRLMERFQYGNRMAAPRLSKVVLNMGIGEAVGDQAAMADGLETLRVISGQQPVVTKARRSVAGFHVREGTPLGCRVTLRGRRMFEFLDRLISVVLPRVRDFRGISRNSFDGTGNFSLGLREVVVFPELDLDKLKNIYGLDITIVTSAHTDQESFELLSLLGMPFRQ